jgi:hypothetical protein
MTHRRLEKIRDSMLHAKPEPILNNACCTGICTGQERYKRTGTTRRRHIY